jgi:hypothetical protein
MKKIILARWVLLSALGLMGSVGLFGTGVGEAQAVSETIPVKCLAGTAFDAAKMACVPCPVGQYTNTDGAKECLKCPDGHICPSKGTSQPTICKANKAATFDRTKCLDCVNGFYSLDGFQCTTPTNTMDSCCLPLN